MIKKLNSNIENKVSLAKVSPSKNADGFKKYLQEIQKFPLLTPKEEYD